MVTLSLDYRTLLLSYKSIMSLSLITLGGLEILGIDALVKISPVKILLIWFIRD
jgi:hypothetical protein